MRAFVLLGSYDNTVGSGAITRKSQGGFFFVCFFPPPPPQQQVAALAPVHQCAAPHGHTHSHDCDTYQPPLCFCLCYRKQTRATMFVLRIRGECVHFDVISSDIFLTDCRVCFLSGHKTIPGVPLYLAFFSFPVINRLIPAIYLFIYFFKQCSASWYVTS